MSAPLAYYNENDPAAAEWLENLISAGLIARGHVDRRSIKDVQPNDLHGYTQHHFFAGIGGWSAAARLAGWPDARPLWTASCPCQPFSVAGKGLGTDDPRHLWPDLFRLWRAHRPAVLVGEQVAAKAGYDWFNGVCADLDGEGATARAVDIPACAVDAPHKRLRLYWVALANSPGAGRDAAAQSGLCAETQSERPWDGQSERPYGFHTGHVDNGQRPRLEGHGRDGADCDGRSPADRPTAAPDGGGSMADGDSQPGQQNSRRPSGDEKTNGRAGWLEQQSDRHHRFERNDEGHRRNGSFWTGADWIICHDDKARRVADASASLLVDGLRGRVAVSRPDDLPVAAHPEEIRLVSRVAAWRGFGNAIVPPLAAEVLAALADVMEAA